MLFPPTPFSNVIEVIHTYILKKSEGINYLPNQLNLIQITVFKNSLVKKRDAPFAIVK